MKMEPHTSSGVVASLHLHPAKGGEPFQAVEEIQLEEGKGIVGNPRYYARVSSMGGLSKRQVSIIERKQVAEHAAALGLKSIPAGIVRSNIETQGIDLIELLGWEVEIGEAAVLFYDARTPCAKMDRIAPGLRKLMEDKRQGVMAQVVRSGRVRVGDKVRAVKFVRAVELELP